MSLIVAIQKVSSLYMSEPWTLRAKQRMKHAGISQDDLIKPLGVKTRGAVGHYLTGRRQPTPMQLLAIANAIKCSVDWLLSGKEPATATTTHTASSEAKIVAERYDKLPLFMQTQVRLFLDMQHALLESGERWFTRKISAREEEFYKNLDIVRAGLPDKDIEKQK